MFGFISVDKETISPKDYTYFNSFYCGLCLTIKKRYGNKARIFNNFDSTFAFTLLASYLGLPILITRKNCIVHWFKKIPVLQLSNFQNRNLSETDLIDLEKLATLANSMADITILLVKGKTLDNIYEKNKNNNISSKIFKKTFKKAQNFMPNFDNFITQSVKKTLEFERNNCDNPEILANISGEILGKIPCEILKIKNDKPICKLFYELGKWIYYIDAIYDLEDDFKKHSFNPFIVKFQNFKSRQEFVSKNKFEILKYLNEPLDNIIKIYCENLRADNPNSLIDNIILKGLKKQQNIILTNPDKKLSN